MKRTISAVAAIAGTCVIAGGMLTAPAQADKARLDIQPVPYANPRDGIESNVLTPSATMRSVAFGNLPLVNPDAASGITHYGYNTAKSKVLTQSADETHKTEPDKNVYLTFGGRHFVFQGHETGPRGYVTRIDLDETDPAKRVSLVSFQDTDGKPFPTIDGITWNPFTKQLLVTAEASNPTGGVWGITLDANGNPTTGRAVRVTGMGSGGYEGIQTDKLGTVYLVEDIGGKGVDGGKVPNSYVYRYIPTDKKDLTKGGTLQALAVLRQDTKKAATAAELQANPRDQFIADLHQVGRTFSAQWVTLTTGTTMVDATATAAAKGATPFKRPENGVFRPGTDFRDFYFTETGDTSATSTLPGAYGGVFRISMPQACADKGTISLAIAGDVAHTGLDNIQFLTDKTLLVVEDAGDTLHGQRNALDSGYAFDLSEGGRRGPTPVRFLAEGRDGSATFDAMSSIAWNDGDNEITGIHVSDGDASVRGLLGAKVPNPLAKEWRTFWTQQHGDNTTWEITWNAAPRNRH